MTALNIDQQALAQLSQQAKKSPRLRSHLNLHKNFQEAVQSVLISLQQGTYVKPHLHPLAHKKELIIGVNGATALVFFDGSGAITQRHILAADASYAVEVAPFTWHCLYPLEQQATIMEIKQGPYSADDPCDFAEWAPDEGDAEVPAFLRWLQQAKIGQRYQK